MEVSILTLKFNKQLDYSAAAVALLLLALAVLINAPSVTLAEKRSSGCVKQRSISYAPSYEELGRIEATDANSACSIIYSKRTQSETPGQIVKLTSVKALDRKNFSVCNELLSSGLNHTALLFCSQIYSSKWEALCCPSQ